MLPRTSDSDSKLNVSWLVGWRDTDYAIAFMNDLRDRVRMHMRQFTRLTNAFSKKFDNHMHMVALYTVFYNWT
jgi:hypothetical protein